MKAMSEQDQRQDEALMRRRLQNRIAQRRFREKRNSAATVFAVRTALSSEPPPDQRPLLPPELPLLPAGAASDHHMAREDAPSIGMHASSYPFSTVDLSWMHDSHLAFGLDSLEAHTSVGLDTVGLHVAATSLSTSAAFATPIAAYPETRTLDPVALSIEAPNSTDIANDLNDRSNSNTSNSAGTHPAQVASDSVIDDATVRHMINAMKTEQASVQLVDTNSWQSALHLAARGGHTNIVRTILQQHKIDTNIRDSEGQTPLMHAVAEGREDVVRYLLASGACLGKSDATGRTSLHLAAERRQLAVLRLILDQNGGTLDPFLNFYDSKGRTPLHVAVEVGFEEGVEVLLQKGASLQLNCSRD